MPSPPLSSADGRSADGKGAKTLDGKGGGEWERLGPLRPSRSAFQPLHDDDDDDDDHDDDGSMMKAMLVTTANDRNDARRGAV